MPNTFAPRALEEAIKDRVELLRMDYDGDPGEVKEWHAIVDMLDAESTAEFRDQYGASDEIPHVVDGFESVGKEPDDDGEQ